MASRAECHLTAPDAARRNRRPGHHHAVDFLFLTCSYHRARQSTSAFPSNSDTVVARWLQRRTISPFLSPSSKGCTPVFVIQKRKKTHKTSKQTREKD